MLVVEARASPELRAPHLARLGNLCLRLCVRVAATFDFVVHGIVHPTAVRVCLDRVIRAHYLICIYVLYEQDFEKILVDIVRVTDISDCAYTRFPVTLQSISAHCNRAQRYAPNSASLIPFGFFY